MIWSLVTTLAAFVCGLGLLVIAHELGHFGVAKWLGVAVERFSIGFGPILWARRRGETEYAVKAIPMGGSVKMLDVGDGPDRARAFESQSVGRRAAIVVAGPAMSFVLAYVLYAALSLAVGIEGTLNVPVIGAISAGLPADEAGLRAGDRIVAIDGRALDTWDALADAVFGSRGARLQLLVERDGARLPLDVTPKPYPRRTMFGEDDGEVYRIGIEPVAEWRRVGPLGALAGAAGQTWTASAVVGEGLLLTVQGRVPLSEMGGPIAIARAAGEQARAGLARYLAMLAFLSVNLGVLNLLPIPVLDGGHLAFFAIEALMRRPMRQRHRLIVQNVGLAALITITAVVVYNDVYRLVLG